MSHSHNVNGMQDMMSVSVQTHSCVYNTITQELFLAEMLYLDHRLLLLNTWAEYFLEHLYGSKFRYGSQF